ncbi:30S ribosomal protein S19 [Candidatus Woesearchaeota archaeon]|nr:30S ribosomal protein S19 [Candidatus Woesearchaeota archaeon]
MARKEFTYRGKTMAEMLKMSQAEFSELLPARQRRSLRKGLSEVHKKLLADVKSNRQNIRTHLRDMIVFPVMVNRTIRIHNGKEFVPITISAEMLGHYFGEFILTRKRVQHHAPGIGATRSSASLSVK